MTTVLPDPARSIAVLIGVSSYSHPDLLPIPAAANNLERFERVLTDPALGGWPRERVIVLENPETSDEVVVRLRDLAPRATDLMMIYYVGHGSISSPGNEFCMAVAGSHPEHPDTGIVYQRIKTVFQVCPARVKLAILDSCFSGQAITALSPSATLIEQSTKTRGVMTITAAKHDEAAHVVPASEQAGRCTSFTGELLDLLEYGIPSEPELLDLNTIYVHLRANLVGRGLPRPNQSGTDTVGHTVFFKNNAATLQHVKRDLSSALSAYGQAHASETAATDLGRYASLSETPRWLTDFAAPGPVTLDYAGGRGTADGEPLAHAAAKPGWCAREHLDQAGMRELLGISRMRLRALLRHPDFPRPVENLKPTEAGPKWDAQAVLRAVARIEPDQHHIVPRLWQPRHGNPPRPAGTRVEAGFYIARWRTPEAYLHLMYPLAGHDRFPAETQLPHLLSTRERLPATAVVVTNEFGHYAPDLIAVDLDRPSRRYDVAWSDLADYLGEPAPWWPGPLRRPAAMAEWDAQIEPVPRVDLTPILELASAEPAGSPAAIAALHLLSLIRDRLITSAESEIRLADRGHERGRWDGLAVAAHPPLIGLGHYEHVPDALLQQGWETILNRDDPRAAAACLIALDWTGGSYFPFGETVMLQGPFVPAAEEWIERLVPAPATAATALLPTDKAVRTLKDPLTGMPVVESVGYYDAFPPQEVTYQALAPLRLPTRSPLREVVLANEVWIRTEDGTVYPAPQCHGSGLGWGYGGTGPHTLALLIETLLGDIGADAVEIGSGYNAGQGLIDVFTKPSPPGTVLSAEQLRLARLRNTVTAL